MSSLYRALLFVFWMFLVTPAIADNTKEALDQIADFSERICQTAPLHSSANELELTGEANAGLKGLVTKVAGLGIEGAAKYKSDQSEGVLQKDLAPLLSKSADCKERVSGRLIDRLVRPGAVPSPVPTHDADTIYQNGLDVGHVTGAEPRLNQSVVYFSKITDTQKLDRNRNFQYRKWILHLLGDPTNSSAIAIGSQGPEAAVLEGQLCRIVGAAIDPNVP